MGFYVNVHRLIWNDDKFPFVSDDCQLVFFHVLTTPLGTQFGLFKAGLAGLAEDKRWLLKKYTKAFREALKAGFFEYDERALLVRIPHFLNYNKPNNPNVFKSWGKAFNELPNSSLKDKHFEQLKAFAEGLGEGFNKAFAKAFAKPLRKDPEQYSETDSDSNTTTNTTLLPGTEGAGQIKPTRKTDGTMVWESYSEAYEHRYGTSPVRNAKTNTLCKRLVERLGEKEAPQVAYYYLSSRNSYHVGRGHSLDCLLADCEKVRTEWATGQQITQTRAREEDRLQKEGAEWSAVIEKHTKEQS